MYKIRTLNNISEEGLKLFGKDSYSFAATDDEADAILVRSFKMHEMDLPENVKIVARAGAGVNNIPLEKYAEKGVVVCNTPGANANAVKELVVLGLLLSSRKIVQGIKWLSDVNVEEVDVSKAVEKEKSKFAGQELTDKKIGVIGLGAIGMKVANVAVSLGMKVYGYDPFVSIESAWGLDSSVERVFNIDDIMTECDYVTLHVPLMEQTKDMMNTEKFNLSKNGIRLLNFARGGLVNLEDLKQAMEDGKVICYVTDFPENGLVGKENVITIPHLGASTHESEENCARMAANQVKEYLENGNIMNSVNYPNCYNGVCQSHSRIALHHKNVPNMVGQISAILAKENLNISDMMNKSKDQYAYTLIDVDTEVGEHTVDELLSIPEVIRVRIIKGEK